MKVYTTNPSLSTTPTEFKGNWEMLCLINGCDDPGRYRENCNKCGWNRIEDRRRKYIPLEKGPDGLYRKNVTQPRKITKEGLLDDRKRVSEAGSENDESENG